MSACQENRNMERDIRSNIKEARTKTLEILPYLGCISQATLQGRLSVRH